MRFVTACLIALIAVVSTACGSRDDHYSYSYHKANVSQSQLLADEARVTKMPGVVRVTPKHNQDGSATLEVEVESKQHIEIQQKMSDMGYTKGLH